MAQPKSCLWVVCTRTTSNSPGPESESLDEQRRLFLGEGRQSSGPSRLLLSRLVVLSPLRTDLCRNIRDGAGRSDSRRSIVLCGKEWEVFQSRFLDAPTRALKRDGRGVEGNPQIGVLGA